MGTPQAFPRHEDATWIWDAWVWGASFYSPNGELQPATVAKLRAG